MFCTYFAPILYPFLYKLLFVQIIILFTSFNGSVNFSKPSCSSLNLKKYTKNFHLVSIRLYRQSFCLLICYKGLFVRGIVISSALILTFNLKVYQMFALHLYLIYTNYHFFCISIACLLRILCGEQL